MDCPASWNWSDVKKVLETATSLKVFNVKDMDSPPGPDGWIHGALAVFNTKVIRFPFCESDALLAAFCVCVSVRRTPCAPFPPGLRRLLVGFLESHSCATLQPCTLVSSQHSSTRPPEFLSSS